MESIQHIVDLINNRPRKRLGFRTPLEVLYKFFVDFVALDLTIYLLIWYNAFNSRLNMSARQIGIYRSNEYGKISLRYTKRNSFFIVYFASI